MKASRLKRRLGFTHRSFCWLACACFQAFGGVGFEVKAEELVPLKKDGTIRIATYNVSLNRPEAGQLSEDLKSGSSQAKDLAAVIRTVKPDILLLNEVDYDVEDRNAQHFNSLYLADEATDALGNGAWKFDFVFDAPVNTGVPSGLDLNQNDASDDPEDAWGYGRFPGQYGMAVLSRFELDPAGYHLLQKFRWSALPSALMPRAPGEEPYYKSAVWEELRLSSKSFWDLPVRTSIGVVHVLASHPTPPAFDGPEDRNGCRNHDEIRLIQEYIEGADYLRDDEGQACGLKAGDSFVVLGDLNSDPMDGGSRAEAIASLLSHPRVAEFAAPSSLGAVQAAEVQAGANRDHQGSSRNDTGDFSDRSVGNLRVDYVLPSSNFEVVDSGVFWPALDQVPESLREAVRKCLRASDHHLVWVDVKTAP